MEQIEMRELKPSQEFHLLELKRKLDKFPITGKETLIEWCKSNCAIKYNLLYFKWSIDEQSMLTPAEEFAMTKEKMTIDKMSFDELKEYALESSKFIFQCRKAPSWA